MNPFVNPKKRGIQLPKGCKDLVDVLQDSNQAKCEYCDASAVALHFMGMVDHRWCAECQRDLREFAEQQEYKFDFDTSDETVVSRFRAETQRRQDDFMRQRLKERKSK
jgi:hypothetical protein